MGSAWMRRPTASSITPPRAAGTSSSHSTSQRASAEIASPPLKPATEPVAATWSDSRPTSRPPSLAMAPPTSPTATTRMPAEWSRKASGPPTLPKPWMTARLPAIGRPIWEKAARAHTTQPDEVAPAWARVPPTDSGFPVTDSARYRPWVIDNVSISQAITRPSVLMSGAGTSRSGPSSGLIS